jgi:hypothetical protein
MLTGPSNFRWLLWFCFIMILQSRLQAQFNDVAAANGIFASSFFPFHGSGCSFVDFDEDGLDDITFLQKNAPPLFFKNNGGTYSPHEFLFIPQINEYVDGKTWLWFDFDNDGLKDFLYSQHFQGVQLYKNQGNNTFIDVTAAAQILVPYSRCMGVAAGDYDRNGFLDFFICKFHNHDTETDLSFSNQLFQNNGDGTFTDVTVESGIGQSIQASFMPVFSDFNRDGWQDIYVVNDKIVVGNYLYMNNGDGTFTNTSDSSGAGVHLESMCGTIEDYDNDNDLDIFVSNNYSLNALLQNDGNALFEEIAEPAGLSGYDPQGAFWGSVWIDYDNNTWQDLLVCEIPITPNTESNNDFFINNGDDTFTLSSVDLGINTSNERSYCSAMGDINTDGYPDVIISNQYPNSSDVWLNAGGDMHYLTVNLTGTSSNRDGIGTFIDIWFGGKQYTRYTHCGEGFLTQNSHTEFFGLGEYQLVDSLKLSWLSGIVETYYRIPADQHLHLTEGMAASAWLNEAGVQQFCPSVVPTINCGDWTEYLWSNGETSHLIQPTDGGTYYCKVIDSAGNQFLTDTLVMIVFPELQYEIAVTAVSCFGSEDGIVEFQLENDDDAALLFAGNMSNGLVVNEVASGVFGYALLDQYNCWSNGVVHVEHPAPILISLNLIDAACHGENSGVVLANVSGGTAPYEIQTDYNNPEELYAGEYEIAVLDAHDCHVVSNFSIHEPPAIVASVQVNDVLCSGDSSGSAAISASGGTGNFSFHWQDIDPQALPVGEYEVVVTDDNGCSLVSSFAVGEPEPLAVQLQTFPQYEGELNGAIDATISGGVPPYTIFWSNGEDDVSTIDQLATGNYAVLVSDANGCSVSEEAHVDFITHLVSTDLVSVGIFPNPASNEVSISWNPALNPDFLIIHNAIGQEVLRIKPKNNPERISLYDFPSGLYKVTVKTTITNQSTNLLVR